MKHELNKSGPVSQAGTTDTRIKEEIVALATQGKAKRAFRVASDYVRQRPNDAVGWHLLAILHYRLDEPSKAVQAARQAIHLRPNYPEAYNNLGAVLQALGQKGEAEEAYRNALRLAPGMAEAYFNLGELLAAHGRDEEALVLLRGALTRQPAHNKALERLGELLRRKGELEEAALAFRRLCQLAPDDGNAHLLLGETLRQHGLPASAEPPLRRALEFAADDPRVLIALGGALQDQGRVAEAAAYFQQVADRWPDDKLGHFLFGVTAFISGHRSEAEAAYRRALAIDPEFVQAWHELAACKRFSPGDPDLALMEALLPRVDLGDKERALLEYAVAKGHADIGESPEQVFPHYLAGAKAGRRWLRDDLVKDLERLQTLAQCFTPARMAALAGGGDTESAPIFIIGMPRSGTTLVEQILASHPTVFGGGERNELDRLVVVAGRYFNATLKEWVPRLRMPDLALMARQYRAELPSLPEGRTRLTDKMPTNFALAGLIHLLMPNARIVHIQRNPVDTCFSCFTHLFVRKRGYYYDLEELGRYYRAYVALMDHWRSVLPSGVMHELRYEELVREPEPTVRRLVEYCGLDWRPEFLEFHRTDRPVQTPSAAQVRQPIHTGAIGRWRPYEAHLGPLLKALGGLTEVADTGLIRLN